MKATISKTFSFDAAHQLPHHDGKCANLHGHTYKVIVFFSGHIQEVDVDGDNPEGGMVVDFYKISEIWKEELEPLLDHQMINESLEIVTTAENLAAYIVRYYHGLSSRYSPATIVKVQVWETPTSCAEVTLEDILA